MSCSLSHSRVFALFGIKRNNGEERKEGLVGVLQKQLNLNQRDGHRQVCSVVSIK